MNTKEVLCIIPARGGSKGIPGKNLRIIAGKPLIAYTIEAAKAVGAICRIVVSTDSPAIRETAMTCGAEVIMRPDEISGDAASSEAALLHALEYLREVENYKPEILVFLQCTSPLTLPEDIQGTYDALVKEGADTALSVTPFYHFLWKRLEGDAVGINHDKRFRLRRQDIEPQFLENGAVYVMLAEGFTNAKHRFFGRTVMYAMPHSRTLEIDESADLSMAELYLSVSKTPAAARCFTNIKALVMDFDGVMTDNRVLVNQHGEEAVLCSRSDGLALGRLVARNFPLLVISKETNPVVSARCRKLGIECRQGADDKPAVLRKWLHELGIDPVHAAYAGNDVNDLPAMAVVGLPLAVADAYPEVKRAARVILQNCGGKGALREIADYITTRSEK